MTGPATPHARTGAPALLRDLWRASPPLTAVGIAMLGAAALSAIGLVVDDRIITGAPAWLKPVKFGMSTAIYSLTLAWMMTFMPAATRMRRIVGWTTALVFVFEVVVIDWQAWRGTTSHFNVATPRDSLLFALMGIAIMTQTLTSIAVAVVAWRTRFADRALGWAFRLGMTTTILGAFTGPLMTRPTAQQLADARAGARMTVVGSHTVGAPDGGPGLPLVTWSRDHGDVRVPHFIGLHAIQALALLALLLRTTRRPESAQVRLMFVGAASYVALFGILLWQALRGQSIVGPDALTLGALGTLALSTLVAATWASRARVTARDAFTRSLA